MTPYDITILTDQRYVTPSDPDDYTLNVLTEDRLIREALERRGMKVHRTNWDNPEFDWTSTRYALFRTTWDYFERYEEFATWLDKVSDQTTLINPADMIRWNIDKHYLEDLERKGVHIPPTLFIEVGNDRSISEIYQTSGWDEAILKPAVSGAARHTYRVNTGNVAERQAVFGELIEKEAMLLQEFQQHILTKGEVALMVFGGKFSHAILKRAKPGDFRVQDDFGGTVHDYDPAKVEIDFAERVVALCDPLPVYARVDVIWNNNNVICLSELELIEPELWMRTSKSAADLFAEAFMEHISQ